MHLSLIIDFQKVHLAGNHPAIAGFVLPAILHGMFEYVKGAWLHTGVFRIDKNGPLFKQTSMLFKDQIDCCIKERMTGTYECGQRLALDAHKVFLEGYAFVSAKNGLACSDEP